MMGTLCRLSPILVTRCPTSWTRWSPSIQSRRNISLRQESKAPTFAMTYQGTYATLMTNCGFSLESENGRGKYQALYKVSIDWVNDKLNKAAEVGYITCAFGLRVRTPLLKQVIRGTRQTLMKLRLKAGLPAMLSGRAGACSTQGWIGFMSKVRISEVSPGHSAMCPDP